MLLCLVVQHTVMGRGSGESHLLTWLVVFHNVKLFQNSERLIFFQYGNALYGDPFGIVAPDTAMLNEVIDKSPWGEVEEEYEEEQPGLCILMT